MSRLFSDAEIEFMRTHAAGRTFTELTKMMNDAFGTTYRIKQVKNACHYKRFKNGRSAGAPKGTIPSKRKDSLPVGTERTYVDGRTWVKVSDNPALWQYKHIVIWTKANGEVPAGCKVIFADGNINNFEIDNLVLVTLREFFYMGRKRLRHDDTDLTKTAVVLTKLKLKIIDKTKNIGEGL